MMTFDMRILLPTLALLICATLAPAQHLRVSSNHRHLERADSTPFLYLGDTAWELFHRLNREEADRYLANRAAKGFTVIQAVVLAQVGNLETPNAYGHLPLDGKDPARPNEAYFEHVDYIVGKAAGLGLVIGMLPTWGSYWTHGNSRHIFTVGNARAYGRFLGARYKDKPIIWILGGDENVRNQQERDVIAAMAEGLKAGDGGAHLITYHPRGPGLSSDQFHDADWLDFNMFQSSHGARDHDNGLYAENDYGKTPAKPTVDGEPRYEGINVGFYNRNYSRIDRFDDYDARQAAYWSILAGACGHTYGNNNIWQMWQPGREPVIGANIPWYEALDHPGAFQMGRLRRLFESRAWEKLVPMQSLVVDGPQTGGAKIRAALAEDNSFAFVYSPRGESFTIDERRLKSPKVTETWFDPRYGAEHPIHTSDTPGIQTFTPPTSGRGNDWLLILEAKP